MVAKISHGRSLSRMLNYNEAKVKNGVAVCLQENMYGVPVAKLGFADKLRGLTNYAERNRRAVANAVHVSLNFHPDEKLDDNTMVQIADAYMEKIGFGRQPYLVYRHYDAAHPHLHIVSTNIQQSGERIIMYNIGRNQSEKARREIEKEFNLITASGRKQNKAKEDDGAEARAVYGKSETKRTMANAITRALRYRFTSLAEFNAVLRQFNVVADPGQDGSRLHDHKGLLFFMLDHNGNKTGVPIKASAFYQKPTRANLERLYRRNEALRLPLRDRVRHAIDQALDATGKTDTRRFVRALNRQRIFVLFRTNADGLTYGITFVDNQQKVVFNGSDLGKAYSARAITDRLTDIRPVQRHAAQRALESDVPDALNELLTARAYGSDDDPHWRRRKKKKLKRSR